MASGSPQANVLPQRASVTVNFRMFPGQTVDDVLEHLHKVIKNKNVEINLLPGWKNPSAVSPTDSRSFKVIEKICRSMDDNVVVAPYLVMGGTDSCHYQPICRIFTDIHRSLSALHFYLQPTEQMNVFPFP